LSFGLGIFIPLIFFDSTPAYDRAVRFIKNIPEIKLIGDGWSFSIPRDKKEFIQTRYPIYHLGYVFLENILWKNIDHGDIYLEMECHQKAREWAENIIKNQVEWFKETPLVVDTTRFKKNDLPLPPIIGGLKKMKKYEIRSELLKGGEKMLEKFSSEEKKLIKKFLKTPKIGDDKLTEKIETLSDEEFLNLCYFSLLRREPDPSGRGAYLSTLAKGMTREAMIDSIKNSSEYKSKISG
jgi:hypothetical protein